jgi:hypothetical protein
MFCRCLLVGAAGFEEQTPLRTPDLHGHIAIVADEIEDEAFLCCVETVQNLGVIWPGLVMANREGGMRWRVVVELTAVDGAIHAHEVGTGGSATTACSYETLGQTLVDAKGMLAGLQRHLVQAQAAERPSKTRGKNKAGKLSRP